MLTTFCHVETWKKCFCSEKCKVKSTTKKMNNFNAQRPNLKEYLNLSSFPNADMTIW